MNYDIVTGVKIHLKGPTKLQARIAVGKKIGGIAGIKAAWHFTGPNFRSNDHTEVSVAIGAATVNVGVYDKRTKSAAEYIYPLHCVGRIKTTAY